MIFLFFIHFYLLIPRFVETFRYLDTYATLQDNVSFSGLVSVCYSAYSIISSVKILPAKDSNASDQTLSYFQQKTVHADHAPAPYIEHQCGRSHPLAWTVHTNTSYIAHNGHWRGRSFARSQH